IILNLRRNDITDITALSGLKELVYLNIHSNRNIESIAPIAGLTSLRTLIMRNVNAGKEVELLANLVNLKKLNIRNCSISDISFIADLMIAGALQDDIVTGKKAILDIRDNPIFNSYEDNLSSIRPYWQNISIRAPFILPMTASTLESPEFSHPGGFYKEGFLLELNLSDPKVKIFYTLDGSEPTRSSNLYTGPIEIDSRKGEPNILSNIPTSPSFNKPDDEVFKATVIRARAFKDDSIISSIVTNTYFIDEKNEGLQNRYSLPLISITTDAGNLFDYNYGIFVPGVYIEREDSKSSGNYYRKGISWERPIHIEFFEPDGTLGFSQNAGIRVQGGSTRYLPNKSMRIYARDLYDNKDMFDYPFFPGLLKPGSGETLMQFKSFILRNSGNDSSHAYFRDGMLQALVSHLGFDTQAYRPVIVFINGEYWGIYNIREDYNDWYITTHYDVDMSEVVILEERDARVKVGEPKDNIHYLEMVQFIKENVDSGTINDPGAYEYINTLMDIDNFINYFASQIFILNNDWPQNNIGTWRLRTEAYKPDAPYGHDGRWRWMMFDADLSFALWGQSVDYNTIERSAERNKLFSLLLENNEFKYHFINTMADLLNSIFRTEWTIQKN
ncbi:CotH kinase family protein, partial [Actinomycetota bacterium]